MTLQGSYVRRDINVEMTCDVDFLRGEHVPAVLQGASFKAATVEGNAIVGAWGAVCHMCYAYSNVQRYSLIYTSPTLIEAEISDH